MKITRNLLSRSNHQRPDSRSWSTNTDCTEFFAEEVHIIYLFISYSWFMITDMKMECIAPPRDYYWWTLILDGYFVLDHDSFCLNIINQIDILN